MTKLRDLHDKWMDNPDYRNEYEALEDEFAIMKAVIKARIDAKLTQEELAKLMNTSQAAIARLENGRQLPSIKTLEKLAKATGTKIKISFEPRAA